MNEQSQTNGNGHAVEIGGTKKRGRKAQSGGLIEETHGGGKKVVGELAPIQVKTIEVTVEADTDLIMNAWDQKVIRQMEEDQKGNVRGSKAEKGKKPDRKPFDEYNCAKHLNEKGEDCVPAIMFKHAMVAATSFLPAATKSIVRGSIFIVGDMIPLKFDGVTVNGKKNQAIMRTDMVRVGPWGNKKAMPRYRPAYRNWSCKLKIQFDGSVISADQVVNLLNRAGFNCGIGEWRPLGNMSSGPYGRFHVGASK